MSHSIYMLSIQIDTKGQIFGIFQQFLSTQNVEWDFFCNFQTSCLSVSERLRTIKKQITALFYSNFDLFSFCCRYHPHFKNVMQSRISQLMGVDYKFDLLLSEDGSGRGAALVAAVLKRTDNEEDVSNGK